MFQYISCYSLSIPTWLRSLTEISFNTSHVTLYLFLSMEIADQISSFNTSHVTLYPAHERCTPRLSCFNTSPVTLYLEFGTVIIAAQHVSIHLMLLFIGTACQSALGRNGFNTSHVTLYLMPLSFQIKYLKCFNTSHVTLYQCGYVLATTVHGFQYISCYSLSKERKTRLTIPVSFNTSHVTLYPGGIQRSDYGLIVSIHLMLLFIESGYEKGYEKGQFQYISCYSLSS